MSQTIRAPRAPKIETGPVNMMHGPFPLPEQDANPKTAQWIMEESHGSTDLYQLRMLEDALLADKARGYIDICDFEDNLTRLSSEIRDATLRHFGAVARSGLYDAKAGRGSKRHK